MRPTTVVEIIAGGTTYRHVAMALGILPVGGDTEETPARRALWEFTQALSNVDELVPAGAVSSEGQYVPTEYRFRATPADPTVAGETVVEWPAGASVSLAAHAECGVVPAAPVAQLFADSNTATLFREGDALWSLAVAAVIPGDGRCARAVTPARRRQSREERTQSARTVIEPSWWSRCGITTW